MTYVFVRQAIDNVKDKVLGVFKGHAFIHGINEVRSEENGQRSKIVWQHEEVEKNAYLDDF